MRFYTCENVSYNAGLTEEARWDEEKERGRDEFCSQNWVTAKNGAKREGAKVAARGDYGSLSNLPRPPCVRLHGVCPSPCEYRLENARGRAVCCSEIARSGLKARYCEGGKEGCEKALWENNPLEENLDILHVVKYVACGHATLTYTWHH